RRVRLRSERRVHAERDLGRRLRPRRRELIHRGLTGLGLASDEPGERNCPCEGRGARHAAPRDHPVAIHVPPSSRGGLARRPPRYARSSPCVAATAGSPSWIARRSEEHTSELQSRENLVCRLLLEKKKQ